MADGVFKRLANTFSPSDSQTRSSQEPFYPTPDGKPILLSPVTAALLPEAVKNWSHPFKDKNNPLQQLMQLANAASGSYPLGVGGLWHGGVHFDSGTSENLGKASVHCLADGEVVAYRIDKNSAKTVYVVNKLHVMKPYSRNFVLVRHRLEPPKIEGETDSPPSLFFYSLYMHLQDGATYEGDLTIARPAFWPASNTYLVPDAAKDVSARTPKQYGLNVRHRAHQGKVLDLLPRGAQVTVSGEGDFRKLENSTGPSYLQNKDGSLLGYVDFDLLESVEGGEYRLKNDLNVHVDPTAQSKAIGPKLPAGTQVKISGEGKFRKLEHVTQYVYFKSLQSLRVPQYDGVHVLSEPLPIKAGELIGHIGWYQDYAADRPEQKLHLEVFSEDDVEKFIEDCRNWALNLPITSKTWLKLAKGTAVVAHQDHFNTKQLPTFSTADAVSGTDLLVPKSLLDSLPAADKITVPAMAGRKAYNWYRLNQLLNDADNKLLSGWVREEVSTTPWVSPWEWQDYVVITDYTSAPAFMAAFLRSLKRFTDEELQRYGPLADAGDSGPMKERLYDIIGLDRDNKITAEKLQAALRVPAHAQSISQLIICCESEWYYKPQKWDGLDEMFGHGGSTPHTNWLAEKERIKQLSWWGEVADKVGLPADGKVCHLHPIGMVGWFSVVNPLMITSVQLKQIFLGASDDDVEIVLREINGRLVEFKLDTRLRQRHFFAQIKGEVGSSMKGKSEDWEYSPSALLSFSSYYKKYPAEAEEDGYLKDKNDKFIRRANQESIGSKHFQKLNGNRASHPGDGYNFRGRGLIQITGYEKYHNFMVDYSKYWQGGVPDSVGSPDLINDMPTAIRSAIWFWIAYKVYAVESGKGYSDVKDVTRRVNGGDKGLHERQEAYKVAERVLK